MKTKRGALDTSAPLQFMRQNNFLKLAAVNSLRSSETQAHFYLFQIPLKLNSNVSFFDTSSRNSG